MYLGVLPVTVLVVSLCFINAEIDVDEGNKPTKPTLFDNAAPLLSKRSYQGSNSLLQLERMPFKCQILAALYSYWRTTFSPSNQHEEIGRRLGVMLEQCSNTNFRTSNFFNQTMIFPGTNWCGQTNIAKDFNDLGIFNLTDRCCRDHDFCSDIIQPGKSKHNLVNPYSTTRLNCKCDDTLRRCFRKVNSVISNTMGYIFFSMLQTQCFKLEYPVVGCNVWKRGSVRHYCVQYELNKSRPRKWQWFDQEPYF